MLRRESWDGVAVFLVSFDSECLGQGFYFTDWGGAPCTIIKLCFTKISSTGMTLIILHYAHVFVSLSVSIRSTL